MIETALITGGAGGIGRAFALALAEPGRHLWLVDIDEVAARSTAEAAVQRGASCEVVSCDVRDADAMSRLAERTGAVDLLINNAGVLVTGTVAELSLEDYRRVVDINLWGVIHGCRCYGPRMASRGHGAILNVASLAAYLPLPLMGPYSATKAAVVALSESLRGELRPSGVRVTVLCPSFTRTGLIEASTGDGYASALDRARSVMSHAGASPDEVARCGLTAVERGDLYAIPTRHGKLAWHAKRLMPTPVCRALGALQRFAS